MKIIAFVFARGGSKGVKNKNIKLLGGMPLVAHSILVAKTIKEVNEIYVSTDSEDIKKISKDFGAEVINRPSSLATDSSPEWLSWQHAIRTLEKRGKNFDIFLSLPATSPLRSSIDVTKCLDSLTKNIDVVVTATKANRNPYFNMIHRKKNGESQIILESSVSRRQDAPAVFDMTTVAFVTRPSYIKSHKGLFEGVTKSVIIPKQRAIDIDDPTDFLIAEALYERTI